MTSSYLFTPTPQRTSSHITFFESFASRCGDGYDVQKMRERMSKMPRRVAGHRDGRNGLFLVVLLAFLSRGSEAFTSPSVVRYPAKPVTISRHYASASRSSNRISAALSAHEGKKGEDVSTTHLCCDQPSQNIVMLIKCTFVSRFKGRTG
jgi:hypothetical protein